MRLFSFSKEVAMSNWLDYYKILDTKEIEEKVKKIREVRKWQRLMNVTGAECSIDQKKGGLDLDGKQKSQ